MDGTVGFPCMTPGSAKEWHLPDLSIRVYAMDADIAVPPTKLPNVEDWGCPDPTGKRPDWSRICGFAEVGNLSI
jgi:hypothetical protein